MQFKDVIGQNAIKKQLIQEVQSERIPHAQLFLSRKGTGGLAMSLAFAQYILCDNQGTEDSCGVCPSCSKVAQLIHPDVHFTFPTIKKKSNKPALSTDFIEAWRKAVQSQPYMSEYDWLQYINAENKQGNITAEECRIIIKNLQLKSFEGKHKIQIIWMAESLGKEGNILLKLIEEPPAQTILILVVEQQEGVLNTILSRTQVKTFSDLSVGEIKEKLILDKQLEPDKADKLAFISDGDYHSALAMLENDATLIFDYLEGWLSASLNRKANDTMQLVTELSKQGRETIKQFFDYTLHFFRECLSMKFKSEELVKLTSREKQLASKLWKITNFERIATLIPLIEEKHYHVERNVNVKYILLDLSIQSEKILRGKK